MKILKEETRTHNIYRIGKFKVGFRKNKSNNCIFVVDENGNKKQIHRIKGLKIKFKGANSTIIIHKPMLKFIDCEIIAADNTNVEIKSSKYYARGLKILTERENNSCEIGKDFSCENGCLILMQKEPNVEVKIGDNCMFGSNIVLRTSDAHPIYDKETNELINKGGNIKVGNNVWLGMCVTVLKKTTIADGCVIGTGSIVTKDCTISDAIYVGTPTKLIKQNIKWDRKFKDNF